MVDLARAYEVDQAKIETLFELAARKVAVLGGAGLSPGAPESRVDRRKHVGWGERDCGRRKVLQSPWLGRRGRTTPL